MATDITRTATQILDFWFGDMDDSTPLDREREPFGTHYTRWYGKDPQVDAQIRERFEPDLEAATGSSTSWDDTQLEWRTSHPHGLLALTLLVDQLPRNMYRGEARMYRHDEYGLRASETARELQAAAQLPLLKRLFLSVPLLHAEDVAMQTHAVGHFTDIADASRTRSPNNTGFFDSALDYAKRHLDVVERFGRFPHRNAILGRESTAEELEFLKRDDAYF